MKPGALVPVITKLFQQSRKFSSLARCSPQTAFCRAPTRICHNFPAKSFLRRSIPNIKRLPGSSFSTSFRSFTASSRLCGDKLPPLLPDAGQDPRLPSFQTALKQSKRSLWLRSQLLVLKLIRFLVILSGVGLIAAYIFDGAIWWFVDRLEAKAQQAIANEPVNTVWSYFTQNATENSLELALNADKQHDEIAIRQFLLKELFALRQELFDIQVLTRTHHQLFQSAISQLQQYQLTLGNIAPTQQQFMSDMHRLGRNASQLESQSKEYTKLYAIPFYQLVRSSSRLSSNQQQQNVFLDEMFTHITNISSQRVTLDRVRTSLIEQLYRIAPAITPDSVEFLFNACGSRETLEAQQALHAFAGLPSVSIPSISELNELIQECKTELSLIYDPFYLPGGEQPIKDDMGQVVNANQCYQSPEIAASRPTAVPSSLPYFTLDQLFTMTMNNVVYDHVDLASRQHLANIVHQQNVELFPSRNQQLETTNSQTNHQ